MNLDSNQVTILITDDDDGHAMLIQESLEDSGIDNPILRFCDGIEICDFLSGKMHNPSFNSEQKYLLLLDVRMPKKDGIEVLRCIKKDKNVANIPVIMLTTTDNPIEIAECYDLGCNSYITKPINIHDFEETVQNLGLFIKSMKISSPSNTIMSE